MEFTIARKAITLTSAYSFQSAIISIILAKRLFTCHEPSAVIIIDTAGSRFFPADFYINFHCRFYVDFRYVIGRSVRIFPRQEHTCALPIPTRTKWFPPLPRPRYNCAYRRFFFYFFTNEPRLHTTRYNNTPCVFRFFFSGHTRTKGIPSRLAIAAAHHSLKKKTIIIVNRGRPARREVTERHRSSAAHTHARVRARRPPRATQRRPESSSPPGIVRGHPQVSRRFVLVHFWGEPRRSKSGPSDDLAEIFNLRA